MSVKKSEPVIDGSSRWPVGVGFAVNAFAATSVEMERSVRDSLNHNGVRHTTRMWLTLEPVNC